MPTHLKCSVMRTQMPVLSCEKKSEIWGEKKQNVEMGCGGIIALCYAALHVQPCVVLAAIKVCSTVKL
jgi:hypothetical protein